MWVGRPSVFQVRVRLALRSTVRVTEVFVNVYKAIHVLTISDILNTLTVSYAVTFDSALVTLYLASLALTLRVSTFPDTVFFVFRTILTINIDYFTG